MRVTLVAAADLDRVIGHQNRLPWRLPGDLKRFKEVTFGKPIVMGRSTWESLGRPLPGRTHIVLSRSPDFTAPGGIAVRSFDEALEVAAQRGPEVMVIGGARVYELTLSRCDRILLTLVHGHHPGDAWFPPLVDGEWWVASRQEFPADTSNPLATTLFELRPRRSARSEWEPFAWPSEVPRSQAVGS